MNLAARCPQDMRPDVRVLYGHLTIMTAPRPGQFLLTGSAQVLALRGLPDALPGRMEIIELWPFSQGELERSPDAFADAAFARGPGLSGPPRCASATTSTAPSTAASPRRSAGSLAAAPPSSTPT